VKSRIGSQTEPAGISSQKAVGSKQRQTAEVRFPAYWLLKLVSSSSSSYLPLQRDQFHRIEADNLEFHATLFAIDHLAFVGVRIDMHRLHSGQVPVGASEILQSMV
jgi:hypothetical protein